jgi:hypothetical protein
MHVAPFAPAALLLPAVVLASCTDSGSLTTPADPSTPAFAQKNAPPTSGPNVVRGVPLGIIVGADPETQLAVEAGFEISIAELCALGPEAPAVSLTQQQVSTPTGRLQFTTEPQEVSVDVFQYAGGIITDPCQLVGAPVVATGTATVTWGEKNVPNEGPGAGTILATVHGVVDLTSGGQARLLARLHVTIRPDGSLVRDSETVTLTPL